MLSSSANEAPFSYWIEPRDLAEDSDLNDERHFMRLFGTDPKEWEVGSLKWSVEGQCSEDNEIAFYGVMRGKLIWFSIDSRWSHDVIWIQDVIEYLRKHHQNELKSLDVLLFSRITKKSRAALKAASIQLDSENNQGQGEPVVGKVYKACPTESTWPIIRE